MDMRRILKRDERAQITFAVLRDDGSFDSGAMSRQARKRGLKLFLSCKVPLTL